MTPGSLFSLKRSKCLNVLPLSFTQLYLFVYFSVTEYEKRVYVFMQSLRLDFKKCLVFVYVAMWDKHRKRIGVILYRRVVFSLICNGKALKSPCLTILGKPSHLETS